MSSRPVVGWRATAAVGGEPARTPFVRGWVRVLLLSRHAPMASRGRLGSPPLSFNCTRPACRRASVALATVVSSWALPSHPRFHGHGSVACWVHQAASVLDACALSKVRGVWGTQPRIDARARSDRHIVWMWCARAGRQWTQSDSEIDAPTRPATLRGRFMWYSETQSSLWTRLDATRRTSRFWTCRLFALPRRLRFAGGRFVCARAQALSRLSRPLRQAARRLMGCLWRMGMGERRLRESHGDSLVLRRPAVKR